MTTNRLKDKIGYLRTTLDHAFKTHKQNDDVDRLMELEHVDRRLYGIYLIETYHYAKHNSKNQALVATRRDTLPVNYQKFCLNHALEETGHEYMAFHDLNSIGHTFAENKLPLPLPETNTLIAYLYDVAQNGNPYSRLGYSFWAEGSYKYIGQTWDMLQGALELKDSQMTFYKAHGDIDEQHSKDVEAAINTYVKTEEDMIAVEEVMLTSLNLTGVMLEGVVRSYLELLDGKSNRYDFLKCLQS
jgi:hypothetical protein